MKPRSYHSSLPALLALLFALSPTQSDAANIVLSNDDGWAVSNIRSLFTELTTAGGHEVVLSAPAENQSGTSSSDEPPSPRDGPCQFDSCPAKSPAIGADPNNPRIQYVNSFPVTSLKSGLDDLAPQFFGDETVDLVCTGPNVGTNLDIQVPFSGTVGAAVEAAKRGIPAIAFSGRSGEPTSFKTQPTPPESVLYAQLAGELVEAVLAAGAKTTIPEDTFLNVNFPSVSDECSAPEKFSFVLSRINPAVPFLSDDDVEICGNDGRLPMERRVTEWESGCFVSVSVGDANDKTTASKEKQQAVVDALGAFLTCLP